LQAVLPQKKSHVSLVILISFHKQLNPFSFHPETSIFPNLGVIPHPCLIQGKFVCFPYENDAISIQRFRIEAIYLFKIFKTQKNKYLA